MKATLSLTHDCNLACRYCYGGKKSRRDMSLETAQRIVDFALRITPPNKHIAFSFFGGEPLLRFDLMVEIVRYIRSRQAPDGPTLSLNITSNGTLLTDRVLAFLAQEEIDLCVSVDGPAVVHDRNRVFPDGRGTFAEVTGGLAAALDSLNSVQVNAVYGPDTLSYLPETLAFFAELGVPVIHLNPDIRAVWDADACSGLPATYMALADFYIESYRHGRETAVNMIDSKIILFMKGGYSAEDRCGMGDTEWGFAPSGNIYPCERFIGEDDDLTFCLGNIHTGLDPRRLCALAERRGNRNAECKTCEWADYCMNWCGCTNHYLSGATDLASPMLCASERAALAAARHVLTTLSKLQNDLFIDHFMRYLASGHRVSIIR